MDIIYIGWVRGRPGQRERGRALHAMPQHQIDTDVGAAFIVTFQSQSKY